MKIPPSLVISSPSISVPISSSKNDYSLFTKFANDSLIVLAVYVDDILLIGDDIMELNSLKAFLDDTFKFNDLGCVHYFLGLETTLQSDGYFMSSTNIRLIYWLNFTVIITPLMSPLLILLVNFWLIWMYLLLMLALTNTLLAILISFSPLVPTFPLRCNILVNFLQHPQVPHMLAGIHVLRYIMDDPAQGILLSNSQDFSLLAYSDLDWAACAHTRKSVTGFFISLGGSPISWKSKKQPTISLSSTEAKYRELRMVVAEISWLTRLLGDLGLPMSGPILVYCDNQAALHIAKNPVFHERTKHIVIDCHFVRDCLIYGLISLYFLSSEGQLADLLTKSLYSAAHRGLMSKLGVHFPSSLRGVLSMLKFKLSCLLYRIRPRPNSSTRLRYISFFLF
ncbi:uncharacterized mitochondrial protein AtMg00810-like [Capsicum annuum]|uniref:uncharacterized mitochondrial protein AtMg00810-like n=1 Tax=Capsicum annuum TaxID=4072 RepID=UPI001FB06763|nr:uncharacterized mitochondrial protein AtMg00810-like [Capsicum annuum]XP_047250091.1 uncharacterized mitochondrial protein AtMg00810-like [Capsicum annuum]XP_047250119.1 uncharacterized mitochondrial protein AtMg00810-like [Capsicum annuum]XP_047250138.1 uncharacterized mitochondrial protein AtMg00810-like [Capsicum annuum]XP_047250150.1 uncharacterized mitochondrial protein AtMg00810-like [Capsicum annuum]XP_047250152.1 uncharacterized mitochondrial protein AtMg00810-like [Capsicum annuum]